MFLPLAGGLYLGWSLGANDAANVFGTAVASRIITFRKAAILCGLFVILGAVAQGTAGIETYHSLTPQNISNTALLVISLCAAITVTLMTIAALPVSASQAIVGAITGLGLTVGSVNCAGLQKVIICWICTPIGAILITVIIYKLLGWLISNIAMSMLTRDKILWSGLLIMGIYGSYALGANNVANATGIFSGRIGITDQTLAILGGLAIAAGVITYGKRIMLAVGSGILPLDAFTALTAVTSMAVTVHIFAFIGVPVSTSQAIVGSIVGIGLLRGTQGIHFKVLGHIALGWLMTPVVSLLLTAAIYAIFQKRC